MNHRIVRWVVALMFGIVLSLYVFERISDPEPRLQRAREEAMVLAAREMLREYISAQQALEIVDPLSPNRKVGKVYIYPSEYGWEVSGHYRRGRDDRWHPFLMALDDAGGLATLSVSDADPQLARKAAADPKLFIAR